MPFILGLVGAICWGVAPIFGRIGLQDLHPMDGLAVRTVFTLVFILVWLVGTGGFQRLCGISCGVWFNLGIEAFLATLAGDLAYYAALKWGSAGLATVALSASPIVTVWASRTFLNEAFTPAQYVGMALVIAGVLLVGVGGRSFA